MKDRLRILLAEDHPYVRMQLKHLLAREADFEIVGAAADGREAVELAVRLKPDLLVTDLSMPGLNGLDVTRKTLDGLFLKIAEQERMIREDPVARTTDLLKQVFGAAGK